MLSRTRWSKLLLIVGIVVALSAPAWAQVPEMLEDTLTVGVSADGDLKFGWESTRASMSHIVYGTSADAMDQQTAQYFSLDAFHEHVIRKVEPNTTYYYQIVHMNWSDEQSESEVQTYTTPALESVETISGFGATAQVNLSWEPVFGAATYRVERGTAAGGPYEVVANIETTSYADADADLGVPYYYRVVTVAPDGSTGEPSQVLEVVPVEGPISGIEVVAPNLKAIYEAEHGSTPDFSPLWALEVGTPQYVDRPTSTHQVTSVPEALQGAHLIPAINDDKEVQSQEYFIIDLYYDTTLYIAFDPRAIQDNWLPNWVKEQFEETGIQIVVHDPDPNVVAGMPIFKKEVTAGRLVLPSNMAPSGNSTHYFLIIPARN